MMAGPHLPTQGYIEFPPGLKDPHTKILFHFLYLPSYVLLRETFRVIISFFQTKGTTVFVSSSYMFLDKKALLKIWLNPGLSLTIFRGTRPRYVSLGRDSLFQAFR